MIRHSAPCALAAVMWMAVSTSASAQWLTRASASPDAASAAQLHAAPEADLHGIVLDERGEPLAGVVLSALGSTTVFAVSGRDGRFSFRGLPYGPYLLRAHLQGYVSPRARLIQVNRTPLAVSSIALTRRIDGGESEGAVPVLTASVGGGDVAAPVDDAPETHDHGEVAWRLRHLKRGVLKDVAARIIGDFDEEGALGGSLSAFGWAMGAPARVASSWFADVPWNGHIDLLTSTSFDRPQDLWSMPVWPRGVAFVSLEAPASGGRWAMRGALAPQGDLSSWIVAGSYRRAPAAHRYEAGLSYGVQRYLTGTVDAGRSVGAMYAYDAWTVNSRLAVRYGARYARYDYLAQRSLFSPRLDVTVTPTGRPAFRLTAGVSRHAVAPGAEEFLPPPERGLWLPPERTFSSVSPRRGFVPERINHAEIGAEREWTGVLVIGVRAFHQSVEDQLVTLFGIAPPGGAAATLDHYYVASAGNLDASGWGVRMSRPFAEHAHASVDYTSVDARWRGPSPDSAALSLVGLPLRRGPAERFHDLTTTVDGTLPWTETRVLAIYKVNSRFGETETGAPRAAARFDVQLNQALPFLNLAGADWEMLVAVRSLFRENLADASVYDEVLVVRPPKRIVGGVTVRF